MSIESPFLAMGLERQAHRKKVHTIPELTLMDEILSWNLPLKLIQLLGRVVTVMSWEAPFIPPSSEFILGSNTTGLVTSAGGTVSVVGGEDPALAGDAVRGQDGIFLGSVSTTSTFAYPSATIAAWNSFFATVRGNVTAGGIVTATPPTQGSGAGRALAGMSVWWLGAVAVLTATIGC